jgi:hypothetical protein
MAYEKYGDVQTFDPHDKLDPTSDFLPENRKNVFDDGKDPK